MEAFVDFINEKAGTHRNYNGDLTVTAGRVSTLGHRIKNFMIAVRTLKIIHSTLIMSEIIYINTIINIIVTYIHTRKDNKHYIHIFMHLYI